MRKTPFLFVTILMLLTGCQEAELPEGKEVANVLVPLTVVIKTEESLKVGQEVKLVATVAQGSKFVDQADEVVFEIRKAGMDSRKLISADHSGNGNYVVKHTFDEAGKYYIVAHVTTNDVHMMPEKMIQITDK